MYRFFLVLATVSIVVGQILRPPLNPPLQPPAGMVFGLYNYVGSRFMFYCLIISGQRCAGRNYNGRRCCTPELPCGYGEGDCDGPGDGGTNDGHRGCQRGQGVVEVIVIITELLFCPGLVCGSNNCLKFGLYYHEKDDCCDLPQSGATVAGVSSGVLTGAN